MGWENLENIFNRNVIYISLLLLIFEKIEKW